MTSKKISPNKISTTKFILTYVFLYVALILFALLMTGCGPDDGRDGLNGTSTKAPIIQLIRFSSDTSVCLSGAGVIVQVLQDDGLLGGTSVSSAQVICDGLNGKDGEVGEKGDKGEDGASSPTSPYEVVQIIDPCGDADGVYDEIFFKMQDGTLIASFSDNKEGKNTRLSVLTPGSYVTTDGSDCQLIVHSDGTVTW